MARVLSAVWLASGTLSAGILWSPQARGAAGDLDPTFDPGVLPSGSGPPTVFTMAIQRDDRILIGGSFTNFNGIPTRGLVRLLPDGSVDQSYLPNFNLTQRSTAPLQITSMALLADDRLVFEALGLVDINGVGASSAQAKDSSPARLLPDGTLDASFQPGAKKPGGSPLPDPVRILGVDSLGGIIVQQQGLRRLTPEGRVDGTWPATNGDPVIPGFFSCAAGQSSGQILVFGQLNAGANRDGQLDRLYRLHPDGSLDATFPAWRPIASSGRYGVGDLATVRKILVQPDDKIILLGTFTWLSNGSNWVQRGSVARLQPDGAIDESFLSKIGLTDIYAYDDIPQWNATNSRPAFSGALAPDGRIVIGGYFNGYNGTARPNLVRLNADGTLDSSFRPRPPDRWVTQVGMQASGNVLISAGTVVDAAGLPPYFGGRGLVRLLGGPLVPLAPKIVRQPANQRVTFPAPDPVSVSFAVEALSQELPTFQWFYNGAPLNDGDFRGRISGARTAALTIRDVQQANAGRYQCVVANAGGRVTSTPAFLTVNESASPLPDRTKPLLVVTSHPMPFGRTVNDSVTFDGRASDGIGLARVLVQRGNAPFQDVEGVDQWTCSFELGIGTNVFRFKAEDLAGNSSLVSTRTVVRIVLKGFSLTINGLGNVARPGLGTSLEAGRTYSLHATPKPGNLFSNWVVGGVSYTNPTFTFTMVSDLEVTANFVANPFPALAGVYTGLFFDPELPVHEDSGAFSFKVSNDGRFAGKGLLGGKPFPVGGQFDLSLRAQLALPFRETRNATLDWQLHGNSEQITGTFAGSPGITAPLSGYRAWSRTEHPRSDPVQHTLLLSQAPPTSQSMLGGLQGHGYATVIRTSAGQVRLKGSLADGLPWMASGPIANQGQFPVYSVLPGGGSIFGWLTFAPAETNGAPPELEGSLVWIKPGVFTNVAMVLGSPYQPPARGHSIAGFSNAVLILEGGTLPSPITNKLTVTAANRFSFQPPNLEQLELTLKTATGLFEGRFHHPVTGRSVPLRGVLLPSLGVGGGLFQMTNQTGSVFLGPLERYPLEPWSPMH